MEQADRKLHQSNYTLRIKPDTPISKYRKEVKKEETLESVISDVIDPLSQKGFVCHFFASQKISFLAKIRRELKKSNIKASNKKIGEAFDRLAKEKNIMFV